MDILKVKGGVSYQQGGCALIGSQKGAIVAYSNEGIRVRYAGEQYTIQ